MEYLKFAFTGVNILPSMILVVIVFYWLSAIIGSFSFNIHLTHKIDVHLDSNIDTHLNSHTVHKDVPHHMINDSASHTSIPLQLLRFTNIGEVPLMLYLTIYSLTLWILSMFTFYLHISPASVNAVFILIVNIVISFIFTKLITEPFKGFFRQLEKDENVPIISEFCIIKSDTDEHTLGQAELENNTNVVINIESIGGKILKGERAFVVDKNEKDNVYIVRKS